MAEKRKQQWKESEANGWGKEQGFAGGGGAQGIGPEEEEKAEKRAGGRENGPSGWDPTDSPESAEEARSIYGLTQTTPPPPPRFDSSGGHWEGIKR